MRGEEVVSLGWCFWHRRCFGCLMCGMKIDLPGEEGNRRKDRGKGVELSSVPLCYVCWIQTAGEGEVPVFERGFERLRRFDGGLSRDRIERLAEDDGLDGFEDGPFTHNGQVRNTVLPK